MRKMSQQMKVRAKFAKITALRDAGHHAEVRHLSDTWNKRISNNVKGFYDPKKVRM